MDLNQCTTPERIAASLDRAQIVMGFAVADGKPKPSEECLGYAECEQAYAELKVDEEKALNGLIQAMGDPTPTVVKSEYREPTVQQYRSWHLRPGYQLPDRDEPVDLVYEVVVNTHEKRFSSNAQAKPALSVKNHVVHLPAHGYTGHETHYMSGLMTGRVLYGQYAEVSSMTEEQLQVRDMKVLVSEVRNKIIEEAPAEAVEPWVDKFIDMCKQHAPMRGDDLHEAIGIDTLSFKELFTEENVSEDRKYIVERLAEAFQPAGLHALINLLKVEPAKLRDDLSVTHRINWVLKNALAIRTAVDNKIDQNLSLNLKDRFMEKLQVEAARVAEVRELTGCLMNETQLLKDDAPKTTPPATLAKR